MENSWLADICKKLTYDELSKLEANEPPPSLVNPVVAATQTAASEKPAAPVAARTQAQIRAAQTQLKNKGYGWVSVNGNVDLPTQAAIHDFQLKNRLTVTGTLDPNTLNALNAM